MLESDDILFSVFTRSDRLRPNTKISRLSGTENVKSFVDDFDMERGIVRARVGLSYDSLRLSPCSGDLYEPPQKSAGSFKKACLAPHPNQNKQPKRKAKQSLSSKQNKQTNQANTLA